MSIAPEAVNIRDARAHLPAIIDAAIDEGHVTVVTRHGKRVGAFVPVEMLAKLEEWEDERLGEMAVEADAHDADGPRYSLTEIIADLLGEPGKPDVT